MPYSCGLAAAMPVMLNSEMNGLYAIASTWSFVGFVEFVIPVIALRIDGMIVWPATARGVAVVSEARGAAM